MKIFKFIILIIILTTSIYLYAFETNNVLGSAYLKLGITTIHNQKKTQWNTEYKRLNGYDYITKDFLTVKEKAFLDQFLTSVSQGIIKANELSVFDYSGYRSESSFYHNSFNINKANTIFLGYRKWHELDFDKKKIKYQYYVERKPKLFSLFSKKNRYLFKYYPVRSNEIIFEEGANGFFKSKLEDYYYSFNNSPIIFKNEHKKIKKIIKENKFDKFSILELDFIHYIKNISTFKKPFVKIPFYVPFKTRDFSKEEHRALGGIPPKALCGRNSL